MAADGAPAAWPWVIPRREEERAVCACVRTAAPCRAPSAAPFTRAVPKTCNHVATTERGTVILISRVRTLRIGGAFRRVKGRSGARPVCLSPAPLTAL